MLEFHRIANEEPRRVVANHVVVTVTRVELQCEATRVPPRVGAAALTGYGRESREHVRFNTGLGHGRLSVTTHVTGHDKLSERAPAFRRRLTLGNSFPIEVRHLFNQVMVVQQNRTIRPYS